MMERMPPAKTPATPWFQASLAALLALSGCERSGPEDADSSDSSGTETSSSSGGETAPTQEDQSSAEDETTQSPSAPSSSEEPTDTSSSGSKDSTTSDSSQIPENLEVKSYHEDIANQGYESSLIIYPDFKDQRILPVVIVMHGWMGSKEKMQWIGERVAKQGFATMVVTASNAKSLFAQPKDWIKNYEAAIASLEAENEREPSPLHRRLDLKKISLIGHSMGGGGALFFSHKNTERLKSTVALAPFSNDAKKEVGQIKAPTLILTGSKDSVAPPRMGNAFFEALSEKLTKKYKELEGVGHNDFEKNGAQHDAIAEQVIDWLDRHGR